MALPTLYRHLCFLEAEEDFAVQGRVPGAAVEELVVAVLPERLPGSMSRPIDGSHPYFYLDNIVLKRSWAGEVRDVSLLVAIGVNDDGYWEILGIMEGAKDDSMGSNLVSSNMKEMRGRPKIKSSVLELQ